MITTITEAAALAWQDFEKALNLAQATGNADLAAQVAQALENLDRGDAL